MGAHVGGESSPIEKGLGVLLGVRLDPSCWCALAAKIPAVPWGCDRTRGNGTEQWQGSF